MMRHNSFAAFILTNRRPKKVITYKALIKGGYTGKIYFIVDNEDPTIGEYISEFGADRVIIFDKKAIAQKFDAADNFNDRRCIVYARNACFEIAEKLQIRYFIQLDDDYTDFRYKFIPKDGQIIYKDKIIKKNLDCIFDNLLDYYISIPALTLAIAQGGDFIGGSNGHFAEMIMTKRKAMNTFICSTDRPFKFLGRINEDVNTYFLLGSRGNLFLTLNNVAINQLTTQTNSGGMTELYIDSGTYIKSFYTVIFCPSSVKIGLVGAVNPRLHHHIDWCR